MRKNFLTFKKTAEGIKEMAQFLAAMQEQGGQVKIEDDGDSWVITISGM